MDRILVREKDGKRYSKSIRIFENPDVLSSVSSGMAWKILQALNERPMYPNELARKLKIHEQKIYYHMNRMLRAGLVEVVREENRHGAVCKFFSPVSSAFGFELPGGETEAGPGGTGASAQLREFFYEFTSRGDFDGSIVVGSPTQHGPFLTSARDGHYATQLGLFLGNFCSPGKRFVVKLDTELKAEESHKRNLVIIGGPVANIVCADLNEKLRIRFSWDKSWTIVSEKGKYSGDTDGLIARIPNPWDETKKVILLSGIKFEGTKACILALTQQHKKILRNFSRNRDFYAVIRGLDRDGDGKVDDIQVLE